ncbi:MAG TPA: hypothetical protein VL727_22340 [Puia sp.]|nr:hypothetical protein [Puia sp.]
MENKTHPEDYIAIPSFRTFLIKAFRFFFQFWAFTLTAIRKSKTLLIAGTLVGALVGVTLHLTVPKNFKVSMVVEYTALDKRAYTNVLDQMGMLVSTKTYEILASNLKISELVAENINSIEARNLEDVPLAKDSSSYPFFKIVLGLKSPYGADSLQNALLNYFNDLPFLKKLKEDQSRVYKDQLAYIESETGKMDSLKQEYVHSLASMKLTAGGVYSNAFDPANIYRQSYQLDTMKASINTWLSSKAQPLQLVDGFQTTRTPQSISRVLSTAACVLGGFILAVIFALLIEIKKRVDVA